MKNQCYVWFVRAVVLTLFFLLGACQNGFLNHSGVDYYPIDSDQSSTAPKPASPVGQSAPAPQPRSSALLPVTSPPPMQYQVPEAMEIPRPLRQPVMTHADISYENTTLTEDVVWRGAVLVRGSLVIAPQATVRVEPGTVIRFMKSPIVRQAPRLVVQGRIQCAGSAERPILFAPNSDVVAPGDWEGILLLASEKKNIFEHVRIEGAVRGIEALYSNLTMNNSGLERCEAGLLLRDSAVWFTGVTIDSCGVGIEAFESELEARECQFIRNRRGIDAYHSALVLQSVLCGKNEQQTISADECRIRLRSCAILDNGGGVLLSNSEGQIRGSRFNGNRVVALELKSSHVNVRNSYFSRTAGDAIRMDDGQGVIWQCGFENNSGYNLVNGGVETITAVQNWWGSAHETEITAKLFDVAKEPRSGKINTFPWLSQKPAQQP